VRLERNETDVKKNLRKNGVKKPEKNLKDSGNEARNKRLGGGRGGKEIKEA